VPTDGSSHGRADSLTDAVHRTIRRRDCRDRNLHSDNLIRDTVWHIFRYCNT